ncbi:MAG: glycosyltransferase [Desulfobacteraceae bacterium]|jgi:glycosyltransferase involved in cell wall biosynthesis
MLETYDFDMTRLRFTGFLPYHHYLHVLQASSAHVYLTYPFVLSWSMLEAMSAGCALIASNTPPVAEVVQDNHNGFLVDFFSPEQLFEKISFVLDNASDMTPIRQAARQTAMEHYGQPMCLERQLTYLRNHLG